MMIVIDSSVAAKWLVPEEGSDLAEAIVTGSAQLIAPELLLIELSSFLWKSIRFGKIPANEALSALTRVESVVSLFADRPLCARALGLANELAHPVYDCLYLALAGEANCRMVTSDDRLLRAVRASRYAKQAMTLAEAAA